MEPSIIIRLDNLNTFHWHLFLNALQVPLFLTAFHHRLRWKPLVCYAGCGVLAALCIVLLQLLAMHSTPSPLWLFSCIGLPLMLALFFLFVKAPLSQLLFTALTACWFDNLVEQLARTTGRLLPDSALAYIAPITPYFFYFVYFFLLAIPMLFLLGLPLRRLIDKPQAAAVWRSLWLVPLCFVLLYYLLIRNHMASSTAWISWKVESLLIALSWILCSAVCYIVMIRLLLSVVETAELREQQQFEQYERRLMQGRYDGLMQQIAATRRAQHDLRHHLIVLDNYAAAADSAAARSYIGGILPPQEGASLTRFCEHETADALLAHYIEQAKKKGVAVRCDADLPQNCFVRQQDLCVLLGNVLENALEACLRQTQGEKGLSLSLHMSHDGSRLTLLAENSMDEAPIPAGHGFLSSKHPGVGIGFQSIMDIVRRYSGLMDYQPQEGRLFRLRILLQKPQQEYAGETAAACSSFNEPGYFSK